MVSFEILQAENPLRIGITTLDELEEKVRSFRIMNFSSLKKRFLLFREAVLSPKTQEILVEKGKEASVETVKILRRHFRGDTEFKTYQPDEGIVLISDTNSQISSIFTGEIMNHLNSLGKGAYEGFIDRVDTFEECLNLMKKTLFPKIIIIGYISLENLEYEKLNLMRIRRIDQYIRLLEVFHTVWKHTPVFPKIKNILIQHDNLLSWKHFLYQVVKEYNKGYPVEEL